MKRAILVGLAMLAGGAIGATAVNGLHAQGKAPGAYAILDISEVVDPGLLKQIVVKAAAPVKAAGGQYLARTDSVVSLTGTPPKRVVILSFDNVEQAKAWYNSSAQEEVNVMAAKAIKARWYVVNSAM
jgi:uncharacterized protein (DUF1330 family)